MTLQGVIHISYPAVNYSCYYFALKSTAIEWGIPAQGRIL
ncbi:unnamed protein product, partial [marine sediment metagenome]